MTIEWSEAFSEDVAEIMHYLDYQYCSRSQKEKFYRRLAKVEMRLAIFPLMGVVLDDPKYQREYRKVRMGTAYLIFYEVFLEEAKVVLHRILTQAQRYDILIREEEMNYTYDE
ncbi:type II toxin-antitoxin system RelE/ParE family toxin [Listeria grandensis]|nr:type II toxin-antitoxin system RelE/ParE family toxin [Listeria grandensis]